AAGYDSLQPFCFPTTVPHLRPHPYWVSGNWKRTTRLSSIHRNYPLCKIGSAHNPYKHYASEWKKKGLRYSYRNSTNHRNRDKKENGNGRTQSVQFPLSFPRRHRTSPGKSYRSRRVPED